MVVSRLGASLGPGEMVYCKQVIVGVGSKVEVAVVVAKLQQQQQQPRRRRRDLVPLCNCAAPSGGS